MARYNIIFRCYFSLCTLEYLRNILRVLMSQKQDAWRDEGTGVQGYSEKWKSRKRRGRVDGHVKVIRGGTKKCGTTENVFPFPSICCFCRMSSLSRNNLYFYCDRLPGTRQPENISQNGFKSCQKLAELVRRFVGFWARTFSLSPLGNLLEGITGDNPIICHIVTRIFLKCYNDFLGPMGIMVIMSQLIIEILR